MLKSRISVGKFMLVACLGGLAVWPISGVAAQYEMEGCLSLDVIRYCVDPLLISYEEQCKRWEESLSCTTCEPCYDKYQYADLPNNEQGTPGGRPAYRCTPKAFTEVNTRIPKYYEMRTCDGTTEYRCKSSYNGYPLYQSRDTVTCRPPTSTGSFYTCSGCAACRTDSGQWKDTVLSGYPEYEQFYQYVYSSAGTGSCTLTPQQQFRCAAGYYGTPNSTGTSGCHPCPTLGSSGITIVENPTDYQVINSSPGSTDVTDCYARNYGGDGLVIMNDGTGNFYWDWDDATASEGICYYSN